MPARVSTSTSLRWPIMSAPHRCPEPAARADPPPRVLCGARPWRRHHGAASRQRQDDYRSIMDLCARRPAVRRPDPPAAAFFYSRNRTASIPLGICRYAGILQADAYAGSAISTRQRKPADHRGGVLEPWKRHFFELADLRKARWRSRRSRIDEIFAIEREINGRSAAGARSAPGAHRPIVAELEKWMWPNAPACRAMPTPPRHLLHPSAGRPSPGSSTMAASA